jgi:hypothetical protein
MTTTLQMPDNFAQTLLQITQETALSQAILKLAVAYTTLQAEKWAAIDSKFCKKYQLSFAEYEAISATLPDGFSYETEQEYYDWEDAVSMKQYYENLLTQWKSLNF